MLEADRGRLAMIAWLILIHVALAAICTLYALFLNQRHIYEWYNPDRTWMTVIGGDVLIGLALLAIVYLGALPAAALLYWTSLHVVAGIPIIVWQHIRARKRARQIRDLDRSA